MDKLPTNFFVGIVAGLTGAGMMWLWMGNGRELGEADRAPTERAKLVPASRIGVAEPYRQEAEPDETRGGARRVNAKAPGSVPADAFAAEAQLVENPGAGSRAEPAGIAVAASFHAPASGVADPFPAQSRAAFIISTAKSEGMEDALSAALEAATPYVKDGFTPREDYWAGVMRGSPLAITHQLFGGNEYWFWAGTDVANSGIDVHVYDSEGNLAESEHFRRKGSAGARVHVARTGTYYVIVSDQRTTAPNRARTVHWAVIYGFR